MALTLTTIGSVKAQTSKIRRKVPFNSKHFLVSEKMFDYVTDKPYKFAYKKINQISLGKTLLTPTLYTLEKKREILELLGTIPISSYYAIVNIKPPFLNKFIDCIVIFQKVEHPHTKKQIGIFGYILPLYLKEDLDYIYWKVGYLDPSVRGLRLGRFLIKEQIKNLKVVFPTLKTAIQRIEAYPVSPATQSIFGVSEFKNTIRDVREILAR